MKIYKLILNFGWQMSLFITLSFSIHFESSEHGFETRLGPADDPGLEPGRVEEKTWKEKTRCDSVG